ncbi:MAG TPA: hypothetical protein ENN22_04565 [bacterium]|nr:hypothetical protein [bacterium]
MMDQIPTKIQNLYVDFLKKNKHPKSISLFYKLVENHKNKDSESPPLNESASKPAVENSGKKIVASKNQSWQKEFHILKDEIQLRQYSPRT